jgi:predicted nucleic acid-binding protein
MATLVLDASVAAKWFVNEEHSEAADRLRRGADTFVAPDIFVAELGNVVRTWCVDGVISPGTAQALVRQFGELEVDLVASLELLRSALDLAIAHRRSIYDSLYVALALREGCPLVTADLRLHNSLQASLPGTTRWIGDLPGASA